MGTHTNAGTHATASQKISAPPIRRGRSHLSSPSRPRRRTAPKSASCPHSSEALRCIVQRSRGFHLHVESVMRNCLGVPGYRHFLFGSSTTPLLDLGSLLGWSSSSSPEARELLWQAERGRMRSNID